MDSDNLEELARSLRTYIGHLREALGEYNSHVAAKPPIVPAMASFATPAQQRAWMLLRSAQTGFNDVRTRLPNGIENCLNAMQADVEAALKTLSRS